MLKYYNVMRISFILDRKGAVYKYADILWFTMGLDRDIQVKSIYLTRNTQTS